MPTYRYRCPKCGYEYDKFQKITDKTRAKCPECGARGERVITGGGGILFKGSGFYVNDSKSNNPAFGSKAEKKETKSDDSSAPAPAADSKADSKAEARPAESKPSAQPEATSKAS